MKSGLGQSRANNAMKLQLKVEAIKFTMTRVHQNDRQQRLPLQDWSKHGIF
jgi:hypothetical protein